MPFPEREYYTLEQAAGRWAATLEEVQHAIVAGKLHASVWLSPTYAYIINKLETYNGCILADSVGLGKTFTALAVVKYYELRNKSVLVLCPKKLEENWLNYNKNLKTNIFAKDRFGYDVLCHTDLSRTTGESYGIPLSRINWGNYDLVVIDVSSPHRLVQFQS